jgi:ectoine hydroxylase-related dioxygenase (phytanoyl-CoA dioxygenase family)
MMKVLFPHHACINLELLESEPGLSQQFAHRDFVQPCQFCPRCKNYKTDPHHQSLSRFASNSTMSYSFILAIEEGTKLVFHEVEDLKEETHVELSIGDLVVWRFDTVHAGAAYERTNHRVFGILEGQVKYDAKGYFNIVRNN